MIQLGPTCLRHAMWNRRVLYVRYAMNVLTDVWNELLSDTMLWIVVQGDRVGSTDENEIAEDSRLLKVVVVSVLR